MNVDLEKYGFKEISHIGEGRYFYHIYAYDPYNKGDKTLTFTLNENLPLSYPLIFASLVDANTSLISSNTPT